jgi:hypothetical protein
MAPAPFIDTSSSDFNPVAAAKRTLILCPPSVSSHPEVLEKVLNTIDRTSADVQMLDRLSLNLASLPDSMYSTVLLLSDPTSTLPALEKPLLEKVLAAMVSGGRWRAYGNLKENWAQDRLRFLTAGFLVEETADEGMVAVKPDFGGQKSVALNLRKRSTTGGAVKPVVAKPAPTPAPVAAKSNGVGFVDFSDDLDDDELIDEDELMADEDLATPVQIRMLAHISLLCVPRCG